MPIKKEVTNDENDDDDYDYDDDDDDDNKKEDDDGEKKKTATFRVSFVDSYRLMPSKLSDLVDNLSGVLMLNVKNARKEKILNPNAII